MTVNARMQPFDNEELLEIFSSNDILLDEFGTGMDGDGKTKSNLFIIIPDDDDTFNFVPGMVYTLLFQELYRQARFFGGKLPMDVGFWLDEMANIKMPNNFDKILATCRSRGVYCVPILQSLAQLKTLFADGAWEGIVGNCDTFIYLAVTKQAPMNMSQSCLENGRSTNEPVEKAKEPTVLTVRITMCLAGS